MRSLTLTLAHLLLCGLLMRATGDEWHAEDIKLEVATDSDVDLDWGVAVPPPPLPQRRPHPEHSGGISPVATMREQQQQQQQPASIRPIHWEHILRLLQAGVVQQRPSRCLAKVNVSRKSSKSARGTNRDGWRSINTFPEPLLKGRQSATTEYPVSGLRTSISTNAE